MSDIEKRLQDLLLFSRTCAPEYNTPESSDRVLVFDVMQDDWERDSILESVSATTEATESSNKTLSSVSAKTTREKHDLETTEEQQLAQIEIEGGNVNRKLQNETKRVRELASKQVENKKVDSLSSILARYQKIHKREPLRQHTIYVHSHWLTAQSPYFRSLLRSSGMKETQDKEVHLKIPESEENAHLTLLQAMYNGEVLNDKTVSELLAVLELADKYDVTFVFKICKCVLQKYATTLETSLQIMHVIKVKHNMRDVEDLATTLQLVLVKEFSPLDENWQSEKFTNLSELSVKYLLSSDDLIVQSENTVFHALMYWMEQNKIDPAGLEETNDLLAVVRFGLVTTDYLYNVVKNHLIASKMPKFNELFLNGMIYHAVSPEQKKLLKVQPGLRKKPEGKIVQFTFVVDKNVYKSSRKTRSTLQSEIFWACGYKMRVVFIWELNRLYPHIDVYNLNKESLVSLKFAVVQDTSDFPNWVTDTFRSNGFYACRKKYPVDVDVMYAVPADSYSLRPSKDTKMFDVLVVPL